MVEKWLKLFLGKKAFSSFVGIVSGAMVGAGSVVVATGKLEPQALIVGAITGVLAALTGAAGRGKGEN